MLSLAALFAATIALGGPGPERPGIPYIGDDGQSQSAASEALEVLSRIYKRPKNMVQMILSGDPRELDPHVGPGERYPFQIVADYGEIVYKIAFRDGGDVYGTIFDPDKGTLNKHESAFMKIPDNIIRVAAQTTNYLKFSHTFKRLNENSENQIQVPAELQTAVTNVLYTASIFDRIVELYRHGDFQEFEAEKRQIFAYLTEIGTHYIDTAFWGYAAEGIELLSKTPARDRAELSETIETVFRNLMVALVVGSSGPPETPTLGVQQIIDKMNEGEVERLQETIETKYIEYFKSENSLDAIKFASRSEEIESEIGKIRGDISELKPRLAGQLLRFMSLVGAGLLIASVDQQTGLIHNFWNIAVTETFMPWAHLTFGQATYDTLSTLGSLWMTVVDSLGPVSEPLARALNAIGPMGELVSERGVGHSILVPLIIKIRGLAKGMSNELDARGKRQEIRGLSATLQKERREHQAILSQREQARTRLQNLAGSVIKDGLLLMGRARAACDELLTSHKLK